MADHFHDHGMRNGDEQAEHRLFTVYFQLKRIGSHNAVRLSLASRSGLSGLRKYSSPSPYSLRLVISSTNASVLNRS
ncbi:hypothetical protein D3C73_1574050 [compost metagenome]